MSSGPGTDSPRVQWEVLRRLEDSDVTDVSLLVEQVTETDGVRPLSEHVMLHLRYGGDVDVRHVLGRVGPSLVAYGHLDVTDQVAGPSAELAVAPAYRRQGVGRQLVQHLLGESSDGRLRLWSRGEQSGAAPLAESLGFRRSRTLLRLRRTLYAALPDPVWPDGVRLRSFLPGLDDEEWLALNAAAFVGLPDQGGWTLDDLHVRMREPWFDPAGFLVAEETGPDGDRMVGFHWTKVHGADEHGHDDAEPHEHEPHGHDDAEPHEHEPHGHDDAEPHEHEPHEHDDAEPHEHEPHEHEPHEHEPHEHEPHDGSHQPHEHHHGHDPIGEVYVVGIDPAQQGRGLGRALTLAGLHHLQARGLRDAMLYVDAENTAAIALYTALGFSTWDVDVEFSAP
jgi:mycothiol synthase